MSIALTKLMFGNMVDAKKSPFGLINDQKRNDSIINNAGWFNSDGERLGKGDLSLADMHNISKTIGDEMFIVLSEADSGWNMPSQLDASNPGFDYVIGHISWGITNGSIVRVRDFVDATEKVVKDKIEYTRVGRKTFGNLITAMQKKRVEPAKDKKDDYIGIDLGPKKSTNVATAPVKQVKSQIPVVGPYKAYSPTLGKP